MKNIILTITALVFISLINLLNAQAPNWAWAKSAGGNYSDQGQSVAIDASGNVFMIGYFYSPTITFGSTTLTNAGLHDIFFVKYDSSGNVLWAQSAGGTLSDLGISIATDANGNVIITGSFYSPTITFGSTILINEGIRNIFFVKYDGNGNVLWAKSAGGTNWDFSNSVATDANGNVFFTGHFSSPTINFGTITLSNAGASDIFIVKYDASGNTLWAKSEGGSNFDGSYSITTDASGNVIMTGTFWSPIITFDTISLSNYGDGDIFIVKYNSGGVVLWAKSAGRLQNDISYSVATDANRNVFMTGAFQSHKIKFGAFTLFNAGLKKQSEFFIVKYDSIGNVLWAKSAGGHLEDIGRGIATDSNGNVFVSGYFKSDTLTFDTTSLLNSGSSGTYDIFIAKYDAIGGFHWAKQPIGYDDDWLYGIATNANNNIFITGCFDSNTITFGSTTLTNFNTSSYCDFYFAKLDTAFTTDIEITSNTYGFSIYPNPASDKLTLNIEKLAINNVVTISISDITGKQIYTITATTPKTEINTKDFSKGVYIVKLQSKDLVETRKVIKN